MEMSLPILFALLVVGSASPVESSENHLGLFGRWNLDSELFTKGKLDSESLVMPLLKDSVDCQNFDLNVNCNPAREPRYPCRGSVPSDVLERAAKVAAGLTMQELVVLRAYSLTDYNFVNAIAWGADEVAADEDDHMYGYRCTLYRDDVWPEVEVLNSALNKLPPAQPLDATLWRGSKQSAEELGDVITGGFSSTSHDFTLAVSFATKSLWAIESHISGSDIAFLSHLPGEQEVLFAMGSRLEVKDCAPSTITPAMQTEIEAQELHLEYICNHVDEWFDGHAPDWCSQEMHLEVICMREVSVASKAVVV